MIDHHELRGTITDVHVIPSTEYITLFVPASATATKTPFPKAIALKSKVGTAYVFQLVPSTLMPIRFVPVGDTATNLPLPKAQSYHSLATVDTDVHVIPGRSFF